MPGKILVVDDIAPNRKLLEVKLGAEYYSVRTAASGQEALDDIALDRPDLVLLDVMMPGMDGFEVCRRLKADPATMDIPVVMVTALSESADRVRGLEEGADDFLTKPVNDVALFARVRSLLRLKMTADQLQLRRSTSDTLGILGDIETPQDISPAGARILLLEDNIADAPKIAQALEGDGMVVKDVDSAETLLRLAAQDPPDVIISSLSLSHDDGLRVISDIRAEAWSRQIPILTVADAAAVESYAKALELGANDYVVRPIDRNELIARVRSQVRRKRYDELLLNGYRESVSLALTDGLTGLYNRRYLDAHVQKLFDRYREEKRGFTALIFDIDHFKQINDRYGHDVGDAVLRRVGELLRNSFRGIDLVCRYGGEEFLAFLDECEPDQAIAIAERIRLTIEQADFDELTAAGGDGITISAGASRVGAEDEGPERVTKRADNALYEAKRGGRNRVVYVDADGSVSGPEDNAETTLAA